MQKTVVVLTDDLTGQDCPIGQGETVPFTIDGIAYEIDLNDENAAALRAAIEPFASVARQVGGPRRARRRRLQSVPDLPAEPVATVDPVDPPAVEIIHEPPAPVEVPAVVEPEPEPEPVAPAAPEPDAGEPEAVAAKDDGKPFHCRACGDGFDEERSRKGHERLVHGIGGKTSKQLWEDRRAKAAAAAETARTAELHALAEDVLAAEAQASVEVDEGPAAVVETRVAATPPTPARGPKTGRKRKDGRDVRNVHPRVRASWEPDPNRPPAPPVGVAADVSEWAFPCDQTLDDGTPCPAGANSSRGIKAHLRMAHDVGWKNGRPDNATSFAKAELPAPVAAAPTPAPAAEPVVDRAAEAEKAAMLARLAGPPASPTAPPWERQASPVPTPAEVAPVVLRGRCTWVDDGGHRCSTRVGEPGDRCEEHQVSFASEPVVDVHRDAWEPVVVVHAGTVVEGRSGATEVEKVVDPDDIEWTVVPTLERHVTRLRDDYKIGVPIGVIPIPHANVLALEGLDFDIVESAMRHPDRVEIAPETFGKGYPVLRFCRGDAIVVLGFKFPQQPSIIAAYHGHLLGNDYHRKSAGTGGGGRKKESGLPRNAATLCRRLIGLGAVVDWDVLDPDKKAAMVTFGGSELGRVSVGPNVPRPTVENDWQRMTRKIEAIQQRQRAAG